jgi:AcrR family transcriptional regulator
MTTGSVSLRRADTRRNHERILTAAAKSLAEKGEVSFNAIAKQAGVGVGTVYRHFPTPEALIVAVYQRELDQLVDVVPELLAKYDPELAFRKWTTDHLVHYMITKRGLANALRSAVRKGELPTNEALRDAIATLLKANVEAGTIRADLDPKTVLLGLGGLLLLSAKDDWRHEAACLADLLWRGMCTDDGGSDSR